MNPRGSSSPNRSSARSIRVVAALVAAKAVLNAYPPHLAFWPIGECSMLLVRHREVRRATRLPRAASPGDPSVAEFIQAAASGSCIGATRETVSLGDDKKERRLSLDRLLSPPGWTRDRNSSPGGKQRDAVCRRERAKRTAANHINGQQVSFVLPGVSVASSSSESCQWRGMTTKVRLYACEERLPPGMMVGASTPYRVVDGSPPQRGHTAGRLSPRELPNAK